MKLARSTIAIALSFSLVFISFQTLTIQSVSAQDSKIALQRGYRTGYSDGYMSGYRDAIENATKSYARHTEYKSANRAYNKDYGALEDYQDGYQQGFEGGYETGFSKKSFDATIPTSLKNRGVIDVKTPIENVKETVKTTTEKVSAPVGKNVAKTTEAARTPIENTVATNTNNDPSTKSVGDTPDTTIDTTTTANTRMSGEAPVITTRTETARSAFSGDDIIIIPPNTELIIELQSEIDTTRVREGDAFTAKIVSPYEISGAIIEGRIARNRRPGRIKRRGELLLSFDRIKLTDDRWSNFNAIIVEVLPVKGDNVKRIDNEGLVQGTRPYKDDAVKIGAATGTGVVIGAVVGGPVGAAVGAGIGAAFGVGAVVVERGEYIKLQQDQQLRIKTAYETQIR